MLEIGLEDQKQLFGNCISYLNGEETEFDGALLPEGILPILTGQGRNSLCIW